MRCNEVSRGEDVIQRDRRADAQAARAARTSSGRRGAAARGLGFRWTRSAIAKLEAGQRRLSAAELLMLADMINFAALGARPERRGEVVELADLLPGDGWVLLTNQSRVLARALQMFLRGQLANVTTTDLDVPMLRKVRGRGQQALAGLHRTLVERAAIVDAVWPDATDLDVTSAATEAAGEAEQKAARRLGVPAFAIALEARHRWQRSLSAERDHRVAAQAPGLEPRRLQAIRGHVSRVLLTELAPFQIDFANPTRATSNITRSKKRALMDNS